MIMPLKPSHGLHLAFIFIVSILPANAFAQIVPAGDGLTSRTAFQIKQFSHLLWLRDQAEAKATDGKFYRLMNHIDAPQTSIWTPIGDETAPFNGTFDGSNHSISGIVIRSSTVGHTGFFGHIGTKGVVCNLGLTGGSVSGIGYVGGLAGASEGTIKNCYTTCPISSADTDAVTEGVGGLCGFNSGSITDSYATGTISGYNFMGGLIGVNQAGAVTRSHAHGAVSGYSYLGGLIGETSPYMPTLNECYATGSVRGRQTLGGLIGEGFTGGVTDCYATGSVTSTGSPFDGVNTSIAGLIGECAQVTTQRSYATGKVTGIAGITGKIGGLFAYYYNSYTADCFWDTQTTQMPTSPAGTGKSSAELNLQSTFQNWNFGMIWGIQNSYPYLRRITNYTITYTAGAHGHFGTASPSISQIVNYGVNGSPVTPVADLGYEFARWSDGRTDNPRIDQNVTRPLTVTAIFQQAKNAARSEWSLLR